jgi:hypothetical protein
LDAAGRFIGNPTLIFAVVQNGVVRPDLACPREPFQFLGPGRGCHKECKIGLEHFGGTILLDHPVS